MKISRLSFTNAFVRSYCQGVYSVDGQLDTLFKYAHLDINKLANDTPFSFEEMQQIDQNISQQYDTCHLGFFKQAPPAIALKVTADMLSQATSVESLIITLVETMQAINSPIKPSLTIFNDQATISLKPCCSCVIDSDSGLHFLLALRLLKVLRIIRFLSDSSLPLTMLKLSDSPKSALAAYLLFHRPSAVFWNQNVNTLTFPAKYLTLPTVKEKSESLAFLAKNTDFFITPKPDEKEFVVRLRTWMIEQLKENNRLPSAKLAEHFMECSVKTLTRRLEKEQTSFKELKVGIVDQKAKELLTQTNTPVFDIAEQLGFSETASFCRSFKTHNGMSPKQFRENNQLEG